MDEAKRLSEDVANSTTEFMKVFTEKYITSTVSNTLNSHITNLITKAPESASKEEEDAKSKDKDTDKKEAIKAKPEDNTAITDEKEEHKEEEKDIVATNELPSNYAPSLSTGVYGFYSLKQTETDTKLTFPSVNVSVDSFKKHFMDSNGNEYNAFNIIYSKLSTNPNDPSRFGQKLVRYSRIRQYHESMVKKLNIKTMKFPPKNLAFWKKNSDDFLDERRQELDRYFKETVKNKTITSDELFQVFLGLKADPLRTDRMNVFESALLSSCTALNRTVPSYSLLHRFDTEQDILLLSILADVKDKYKDNVEEIIAQQPMKGRNNLRVKIDKLISNTVQKMLKDEWAKLEQTTSDIKQHLDDILENKTGLMDEGLEGLIGKIEPVLAKKIRQKKDDNTERKERELNVEGIRRLDDLIKRVLIVNTEEKEEKVSSDYRASLSSGVYGYYSLQESVIRGIYDDLCVSLAVLVDNNEKDVITKYLLETVESCYGKDIKVILSSFEQYDKDLELVCRAISELIQVCCELALSNVLLVIEAMDNKDNSLNALENMAQIIPKKIDDLDIGISCDLGGVEGKASRFVLDGMKVLTGIIGNLMVNLVYDRNYNEDFDLKESLKVNIGNGLKVFCGDVLSLLNEVVLSVLLNAIKGEIKDSVDKLCGDNFKFDFIPSTLPESLSVSVLQNVVDAMVVGALNKNLNGKKDVLDSKFYEIFKK